MHAVARRRIQADHREFLGHRVACTLARYSRSHYFLRSPVSGSFWDHAGDVEAADRADGGPLGEGRGCEYGDDGHGEHPPGEADLEGEQVAVERVEDHHGGGECPEQSEELIDRRGTVALVEAGRTVASWIWQLEFGVAWQAELNAGTFRNGERCWCPRGGRRARRWASSIPASSRLNSATWWRARPPGSLLLTEPGSPVLGRLRVRAVLRGSRGCRAGRSPGAGRSAGTSSPAGW